MGEAEFEIEPERPSASLEHVLAAARGVSVDDLRAELAGEQKRQRALVEGAPAAWQAMRAAEVASRVRAALRPLGLLDVDLEALAAGELASTKARRAVERFLSIPELRFLVVSGPVGTGKTLGAVAAAAAPVLERAERWAASIDARSPGAWRRVAESRFVSSSEELVRVTLPDLRLEVSLAVWRASELPRLWSPWAAELATGAVPTRRNVDVVILDDLGTELDGDRFATTLGEVLEQRANRKTVITTNLPADQLRRRYGDRVCDRLNHTGRMLVVDGETMRRKGAL